MSLLRLFRQRKASAIVASMLFVIGLVAQATKPDWKTIALRFPTLSNAFQFLDRNGYEIDQASQVTKTVNMFLLASVPVSPKGIKPGTQSARTTSQPIAVLITSVIESQLHEIIPTEAIIIDARLEAANSNVILFFGQNATARIEGRYDQTKRTIEMKVYEIMLSRATQRLSAQPQCRDTLYSAESKSCSTLDAGCHIAAWIYADDNCKRGSMMNKN